MKEFPFEDAAMPYSPSEATNPSSVSGLEQAKQAHERELMAIDGVEGVGTGRNRIGDHAILVYLRDESVRDLIPRNIDGHPVELLITGPIDAQ